MDINLSYFAQYINPVTVTFCLGFGWLVKHLPILEKLPNNAIPYLITSLAAAVNCALAWRVSPELIIAGAVCGLTSIGVHQIGKITLKPLTSNSELDDKKQK